MIRDSLILAYRNIRERKLRSFLTLLGISVGIAAIIGLMAIGSGMEDAITGQLTEMSDIIVVMPGEFTQGTYIDIGGFTQRDLRDIERIGGVKEAIPITWDSAEVEFRRSKRIIQVIGADTADLWEMYEGNVGLAEGRWLRENDHRGCVIGYVLANEYFDEDIHVGDRLSINGQKFVLVGIFEKGNALTSGDVDRYIFLTQDSARDVLDTDEISLIYVRIYNIEDADRIAERIEEIVDNNHKLDDFTNAMTMGSFIEQISVIFKTIKVVLVGIAAISLIVASIGIMNTMMMAVMERTHDIGIMKAIGARNRDILMLFLIEVGVVSLIGGVLGCLIGSVMALGARLVASGYVGIEIPAPITPILLLSGIAVALLVGVLSGLYPAMKAARMSPVEAVRYE
ncbi:MAG TPA: ABC transporter permease [Candidatus Syntrophoarchaeum butanivorans]|uniref:ABC transporter permease n=1 Tax=Candidatus Syntropharchaeum butanivorans TaxID=1839936 RepID=A0A7C0X1R5_9EURY|nr:MAG: ABC transporter permease [Candidatus Syntrophoarchaeum sp. WYZ-LMO15]HDM35704.1 ABC transporter permease [Candidatus Syntrophoarchaeum butanivorans]